MIDNIRVFTMRSVSYSTTIKFNPAKSMLEVIIKDTLADKGTTIVIPPEDLWDLLKDYFAHLKLPDNRPGLRRRQQEARCAIEYTANPNTNIIIDDMEEFFEEGKDER